MVSDVFRFMEVSPGMSSYRAYLELRGGVFGNEPRFRRQTTDGGDPNTPVDYDEFDRYSRHFLAVHSGSGTAAACTRLILPNPVGLSVATRYHLERQPFPDASWENTAEISRMAVAKPFRARSGGRRTVYAVHPDENTGAPNAAQPSEPQYSHCHSWSLTVGLFRELYRAGREHEVRYALVAMKHSYARLLRKLGMPWEQVGPPTRNGCPLRAPWILSITALEEVLHGCRPELLDYLTRGLACGAAA